VKTYCDTISFKVRMVRKCFVKMFTLANYFRSYVSQVSQANGITLEGHHYVIFSPIFQ
jgi:hypothetical protein